MTSKPLSAAMLAVLAAGSAHAADFINGGFEDGTIGGWTKDGGSYSSPTQPGTGTGSALLTAANFTGAATTTTNGSFTAVHNSALGVATITNLGTVDSITGQSTVFNGNHAVRVNDQANNNSVSLLQQTVTNYTGTSINFAWAAVLQESHGPTDSDEFTITLKDNTTNSIATTIHYNSSVNGSLFTQVSSGGSNWFFNLWTVETIAVTAGHDYTLSLLAADCPYGGHAGYVYLDGFGVVVPDPGVPEPASLALVGIALTGMAAVRRRKAKSA